MRTAAFLLAIVVVVGITREAGVDFAPSVKRDYSVRIGHQQIGFADWEDLYGHIPDWTTVYLGPLGERAVPFSALQGVVAHFR